MSLLKEDYFKYCDLRAMWSNAIHLYLKVISSIFNPSIIIKIFKEDLRQFLILGNKLISHKKLLMEEKHSLLEKNL